MRRIDLKSSDLHEAVTLLKGFLDRKGGVALVPTDTLNSFIKGLFFIFILFSSLK